MTMLFICFFLLGFKSLTKAGQELFFISFLFQTIRVSLLFFFFPFQLQLVRVFLLRFFLLKQYEYFMLKSKCYK